MIKRILTALVLIPLVLLLILRAPGTVLAAVAGIVALLAIREFLALTRHYGVEPFTVATYILTAAFFVLVTVLAQRSGDSLRIRPLLMILFAGLVAAVAPFAFLALGMRRGALSSTYPAAAASVFAFTYIAIPMAMLVATRQMRIGEFHVIYLMLVVWSGDIFAYFVGKSIGRHKMAPRVSPKKTWEGAAASLVASVVVGTLFYRYALPINLWLRNFHILGADAYAWGYSELARWQVVLLSVAVNIAAQLGDLVESVIKRGADVKDSGAILPGHGGMLDRIDAMLFAAPVLWVLLIWQARS